MQHSDTSSITFDDLSAFSDDDGPGIGHPSGRSFTVLQGLGLYGRALGRGVAEFFNWAVGRPVERQWKYAALGRTAIRELDDVGEFYATPEEAMADSTTRDPDEAWEEADARSLPIAPGDGPKNMRFAAWVAREVKLKMGPNPTYSVANERVAWEMCNKVMEEKSVRKCDRMRWLPYATKLVFVPTAHEVHATQLVQSAAVAERLYLAKVRDPWWVWRAWCGRRGLGSPTRG